MATELDYNIFSPEIGMDGWLRVGGSDLEASPNVLASPDTTATIDGDSPMMRAVKVEEPRLTKESTKKKEQPDLFPELPKAEPQIVTQPPKSTVLAETVNPADTLSGAEQGAIVAFGKKTFTDTAQGFIQGLDNADGEYKWAIGSPFAQMDFGVTNQGTLYFNLPSDGGSSNAIFINAAGNNAYPAIDVRRSVGSGSGMYIQSDSPSGYCLDLLESSNTPALHVISDGSGAFVVPAQLENQTSTSTDYFKEIDLRGGSTPDVNVSIWVADNVDPDGNLTGQKGDLCLSSNGNIYINQDGSTGWKVPGTSVTLASGKEILAGTAVAVEADGKAWPIRITEGTAEDSGTSWTLGDQEKEYRFPRLIDVSDTIKLVVKQHDTSDDIYLARYVVDPETGTVSSVTSQTLTLAGGTIDVNKWDAKRLTENKVVICWEGTDASNSHHWVKVIDLTSGFTEGSIQTVITGSTNDDWIVVSVESSTEFFLWYNDNSNGLRARYCTVSGTTVTLSTDNAVTSDTNDQPKGAEFFPGSNHHILAFELNAFSKNQYIIGSNSGGTMTFGATLDVPSFGTDVTSLFNFAPLNSDTAVVGFNYNGGSLEANYLQVISRSGTTVSATHYGAAWSTGNNRDNPVSVTHMGDGEFLAAAHCRTSPNSQIVTRCFSLNGTTLTAQGSRFDISGNNQHAAAVLPFTPTRFLLSAGGSTANDSYLYSVTSDGNAASFVGITEDAATDADENIGITVSNKNASVSGLTAGTTYFTDTGGLHSTEKLGSLRAGVALTTTSILVQT